MKVTTSNTKLLNRFSKSLYKLGCDLIFLALVIKYFNKSTLNSKVFGVSAEENFRKNGTILEARNLFSKYDGADFNEADYVESYDTWVRHGANSIGYSSVISKLREINDNLDNNETSGMTKEQREDLSSFFDLVSEYEDIKNDLLTKMKSIESESNFMPNHPLLPKRRSDDVAQTTADKDIELSVTPEVNITQWVPYSVPGDGNKTQWIPYVVPDSGQFWKKGSVDDNMDPLNEYTNKSMKSYSTKFKDYLLSFGKNITQKSYDSKFR